MNLLLDTHVLIWWDEGRKLASDALRAIKDADVVYVSAATAWEIAIKTGLGRLRPREPWRRRRVNRASRSFPSERVASLPAHHRDPFDRLLIAQAEVGELTLVTRDPVFGRYPAEVIQA